MAVAAGYLWWNLARMTEFSWTYDLKSEYDNRISIRWKYTTGYEKSIELSFEDGKLYYADIRNGKNIE